MTNDKQINKLLLEINKKAIAMADKIEEEKGCFCHRIYVHRQGCYSGLGCKECNKIETKRFLIQELISNLNNYS